MSEVPSIYTSLDATGKSGHRGSRLSRAQRYRFRFSLSERAQYERVLLRGEPDISRRDKGLNCGSHQVLYAHVKTGESRLAGNYCEARTCPACCHSRQRKQAVQLDEWIRHYTRNDARFITLTMQSSDSPLSVQLTDLQASFKRLRRHILWKTAVKYGKAVIEITYNKRRKQWHPHLHVIAVGAYIPQAKLSNAWAMASGGSPICDIRKIKQGDKIAKYLSKYLGKPPSLDDSDDGERLALEYYIAIRNRRMLISFAGAPALPPLPKSEESPADNPEWIQIGSLEDILERAEKGDQDAESAIASLATRINGEDPPPPP